MNKSSEENILYSGEYFRVKEDSNSFSFIFPKINGGEESDRSVFKSNLIALVGLDENKIKIELERINPCLLGELSRRKISMDYFRNSLEKIASKYEELMNQSLDDSYLCLGWGGPPSQNKVL